MSSLSDDLIVWKKLISEILRNSQTFQIIRKPEHQIVSYSQSFRRPASLKNKPSEISRYSQCFSGILRSSDHQIIRVAAIKLLRSSVPQTLKYIKRISDYQSFSHSVIPIFSDYFRLFQIISDYFSKSFHQIPRIADPYVFSDYQILSTSDP